MQALPEALSQIDGNEVCLLLPYYGRSSGTSAGLRIPHQLLHPAGWRQCHVGTLPAHGSFQAVPGLLCGQRAVFDRNPSTATWTTASASPTSPRPCWPASISGVPPDLIQCNDWQTALIPVVLHGEFRGSSPTTKTVFTIHTSSTRAGQQQLQLRCSGSAPRVYRDAPLR